MLETPFSFFISKKPSEIPIFGTFLAKKITFFFQFWSSFTETPLLESGHVWKRHCDVIRWPIFMILVSMERGDPTLYHGIKQSYFRPVNFKFMRRVVNRVRGGFKTQPPVDRRFRPVPPGFYCSKQWQPPGTGRNWSRPLQKKTW